MCTYSVRVHNRTTVRKKSRKKILTTKKKRKGRGAISRINQELQKLGVPPCSLLAPPPPSAGAKPSSPQALPKKHRIRMSDNPLSVYIWLVTSVLTSTVGDNLSLSLSLSLFLSLSLSQ